MASKIDLSLKPAAVSHFQEIFRIYLKMLYHLQQFHSRECYLLEQGGMWKEATVPYSVLISRYLYGVVKKNSGTLVRVTCLRVEV